MHRAVDAMGFAGGFTLGMVQAGFKLVGKCELPGGFGVANCEANRHLLGTEWQSHIGDPVTWPVIPNTDVVFGNPPCSGFSVMSAKSFRGAGSKINHCMHAFSDYVARVRPQVAVFESVQQAYTNPDGRVLMTQLRDNVEERTGERWNLFHVRHNAYSVGGAAQRRRYFWLISRVPFGVEIPQPRVLPVLNDVIGDLAPLPLTWNPQPYRSPAHPWTHHLLNPAGTVDGHINLNNPLTRRIVDLINGIAWNPGEAIHTVVRRHYETHGRLPASWAASENKLVSRDFVMGFTTPTRWNGENHARVITGGSLQMVVHPWLPRLITHREAARVLGFPDNWNILPLRRVSGLANTWGKGISTHCGRWIGEWIKNSLDGQPGSVIGTSAGEREYDIDLTHTWKLTRDAVNVRFPVVVQ
jgi:DNA (cytosine-5)-methyltransferase 1